MLDVRTAVLADRNEIIELYEKVAEAGGGIARVEAEITAEYVERFMMSSANSGYEFVVEDPDQPGRIIGEIHCYKLGPQIFDHVLGELTIAVSPSFQRNGVGKLLFSHLLHTVEGDRPDILRVELISRESNIRAIDFYKKLGFYIEGRMERRTRTSEDCWEADIPMAWFNKNYKPKDPK